MQPSSPDDERESHGQTISNVTPSLQHLVDRLPQYKFDQMSYVSVMSIGVNSVSTQNHNDNNLMKDLEQSYPDQDIMDMKQSLGLLPIAMDEDYMSHCAKSQSGASDLSIVNHNLDNSYDQQANGLDVLAIGANGNDQQLLLQNADYNQIQQKQKSSPKCESHLTKQLTMKQKQMRNYSSSSNSSFQAEGGNANIQTLNREAENEQQSQKSAVRPKERVFYIDWIRSIAIILVIFVHTLCNSFDASGLDPDDVPALQQKKDGIIKSLVQIGIPMFFYISGLGSTFFKTEDKNFGIYVGEKALRLLVPFILGIFLFLIPRLYFGQTYEDFTRPNDEIENNYWEFTKKTLPNIHLKLSWLWYLPALFIDFIICYPLLRWSVRRSQGIKYDPLTDTGIIAQQLVTLALFAAVCYFSVTKDDYGQIYLVPAVCTLGGVMLALYAAQLMCSGKEGYRYALLIKVIGPIGSICMNFNKVQTKNQNLYHILLMINYDAIFFSQGVIDMCYYRKMLKIRKECGDTVLAPIMVGAGLFLYALCSPMNYGGLGQLFFYPLYEDYTLQCLYTTGTWLFVFTIVWVMAIVSNDKFNPTFYKYFTGASLYAYLSHYFWIILLSVTIVRPYHFGFPEAFCIMFFGTFVLIFITYWPLNALFELIFPPKETKSLDLSPEGEAMDLTPEQEAAAAAAAKADALEKGGQDDMEDNGDKQSDASVKRSENE